jgi:hypothetical protein
MGSIDISADVPCAVCAVLRSAANGTMPLAVAWTPVVSLLHHMCRLPSCEAEHIALRLAHAGFFVCCSEMLLNLRRTASQQRKQQCMAVLIPTACATLVQLAPRLAQQCYQCGVVEQAVALVHASLQSSDCDIALLACDAIVKLLVRGAGSATDVQATCELCARILDKVVRCSPTQASLCFSCLDFTRAHHFAARGGVCLNQHRECETAHALGIAVGSLLIKRCDAVRGMDASCAFFKHMTRPTQLLLSVAAFIDGVVVAMMKEHSMPLIRCILVIALTCAAVPLLVCWRLWTRTRRHVAHKR